MHAALRWNLNIQHDFIYNSFTACLIYHTFLTHCQEMHNIYLNRPKFQISHHVFMYISLEFKIFIELLNFHGCNDMWMSCLIYCNLDIVLEQERFIHRMRIFNLVVPVVLSTGVGYVPALGFIFSLPFIITPHTPLQYKTVSHTVTITSPFQYTNTDTHSPHNVVCPRGAWIKNRSH